MKALNFTICNLLVSFTILLAGVDLSLKNGVVVKTENGVNITISGDLTENDTSYVSGIILSGQRSDMNEFAGFSFADPFTGIVTRYTGNAYAEGNGEVPNMKRWYRVNNTGGADVTVDLSVAFVGSGPHDERNGLLPPYYLHSYKNDWTVYGTGSASSPVIVTDALIPSDSSDWIIGNNGSATIITLVSFTAAVIGEGILISWVTETEPENAGFNLYRSQQENGEYIKVTPNLIPSQGTPTTGAEYSYLDTPEQSATYYYKLEDISITGISTLHGPISVVLTEVDIQQYIIPEEYALPQNFPNPFNPETTIQFSLPETGQVSIKIYDINGKLVRNLFTGMKDTGTHTILWNGRDNSEQMVTSGVYFYYFKAGEFRQTNKMILMK